MKNLWFIDIQHLLKDQWTSKIKHFNKILNYFENKNNLLNFHSNFVAKAEKVQYLIIRDFCDGEKFKILLKIKEKPNDMVKIVVCLKEERMIEFKKQISWQQFNQYFD